MISLTPLYPPSVSTGLHLLTINKFIYLHQQLRTLTFSKCCGQTNPVPVVLNPQNKFSYHSLVQVNLNISMLSSACGFYDALKNNLGIPVDTSV